MMLQTPLSKPSLVAYRFLGASYPYCVAKRASKCLMFRLGFIGGEGSSVRKILVRMSERLF